MIPKILHYCWFGGKQMPDDVLSCIASWKAMMPEWNFMLWNEDNFDVTCSQYAKEAYEAGKYAFVSDYVRLHALKEYGGVYFDTDVKALKSFEPLLQNKAFMGFEGSKRIPVGTCVMGSEKGGSWVSELLESYQIRHFVNVDGGYDTTTNVAVVTALLVDAGLKCDGTEQTIKDVHVYPVDFFSPRHTTGEYILTDNTYSDHLGLCSWDEPRRMPLLLRIVGRKNSIRLIKFKRLIFG